jgi:two-component system NarL family sensor kinase
MLDLLVLLQKTATQDITVLIIAATAIFLIAPVFLIIYVGVYNRRKKKYSEEKQHMRQAFESEILKTELEIREQTMQTIGADLHDNIGQLLSLIALTLRSIELADLKKASGRIDSAIDLATQSIDELRRLGKLIQGERLTSKGLKEAIEQEVSWLINSGRFEVNFTFSPKLMGRGNKDTDLILFRVFQEIISNIIKHAGASSIIIDCEDKEGYLVMLIADDGKGFEPGNLDDHGNGLGIFNIRKRVGILEGEVTIVSAKLRGTSTKVCIPY